MAYWVDCTCGREIEVLATQAGSKLSCSCGAVLAVPSLSVLRRQAGERHEPSPEMLIVHRYVNSGEPIGGDSCLRCGETNTNRIRCRIECEKAYIQGQRSRWFWVFAMLVFGWWALLYALGKGEGQLVGEDKVYQVLVSLCPSCQKIARSETVLKQLLRQDREFVRFFDKYPSAKVHIAQAV